MKKSSFITELEERNILNNISSDREITVNDKIYIGFDSTAPSLHLGNLVTLQILNIASRYNIEAYAVVGGATAFIGDPSGKTSERPLLSKEKISYNTVKIINQLNLAMIGF